MSSRRMLVCLGAVLAALLLWGCGQSSTQDQGATQSQGSSQGQSSGQSQNSSQSQDNASGQETGSGSGLGTRLDLNDSDLYYTSSVTTAEAKRLRKYLIDSHAFDGSQGTFQLNKAGSRYQFKLIVQKGAENDQQTIFASNALGMRLSGAVFGGKVVEIHLCDQNFHTLRVVDPIGGSGGSTN
jgi:hypothetical protein